VGIGTSSPSSKLAVVGTTKVGEGVASNTSKLMVNTLSGTAAGIQLFQDGVESWIIQNPASTTALTFANSGAERMRLDSSGNLLVGTTSSSSNTAGIKLSSAGTASFVRSGVQPVYVNRLTNDGDLAVFAKDGTTVGSIGTNSGYVRIGTGDTNLLMHSVIDTIVPHSGSANRDAAINLGYSGARFKDLYLSGGVYLGGTGAANKLDDYEEGTWTPIFADASTGGNVATVGSVGGTYTKVGNLVTVGCNLSDIDITGLTGSNAIYIRGLPFATGSTQIKSGSAFLDRVTFSGYVTAYASGSVVLLFSTSSGASDAALPVSSINSTGSDVFFTLQYQV